MEARSVSREYLVAADFFRWSLYVVILICLIVGELIPITIGPVSTSIVELAVVAIIAATFLSSNIDSRKRTLLWLFGASTVVLILSLANNPIDRVLRDFSQIVFVGMLCVGTIVDRDRFIGSLALAIFIATPYAVSFGVSENIYFFDAPLATQMLFNLRLPVMFLVAVALIDLLSGRIRVWHVPLLVTLVLLVANIRTRGFHVALLAEFGLFFYFLLKSRSRHRALIGFTIAVLCAIAVGILANTHGVVERYEFIRDVAVDGPIALFRDPSVGARLILWGVGLMEMGTDVLNQLFGLGFGKYLLLDPRGIGDYEYLPMWMVHNQVLSIYLTGGIYLLLVFVLFFWRLAHGANDRYLFALVLTGVVVYSLVTPVLGKVVDATFFWLFLGVAVGPCLESTCVDKTESNG